MKTVFAYMCFALLVPGVSMAAPEFSVSIGTTHSTADSLLPGGINSTLEEDFSGTGRRFSVGVALKNWLAFEGGRAELGSNFGTADFAIACIPEFCTPPLGYSTSEFKQQGSAYWLAYAPFIDLGNWRLTGALGRIRSKIETVTMGTTLVQESKESGTLIGGRVAYYFGEHVGFQFDFERLGNEASQYGVGLTLRF